MNKSSGRVRDVRTPNIEDMLQKLTVETMCEVLDINESHNVGKKPMSIKIQISFSVLFRYLYLVFIDR